MRVFVRKFPVLKKAVEKIVLHFVIRRKRLMRLIHNSLNILINVFVCGRVGKKHTYMAQAV